MPFSLAFKCFFKTKTKTFTIIIIQYKLYLSVKSLLSCLTRPTNREHFYLKISYHNTVLIFITIAKLIISKFGNIQMLLKVVNKRYRLLKIQFDPNLN